MIATKEASQLAAVILNARAALIDAGCDDEPAIADLIAVAGTSHDGNITAAANAILSNLEAQTARLRTERSRDREAKIARMAAGEVSEAGMRFSEIVTLKREADQLELGARQDRSLSAAKRSELTQAGVSATEIDRIVGGDRASGMLTQARVKRERIAAIESQMRAA
jgi:hypothetical protein